MSRIEEILGERGRTHGSYSSTAATIQRFKDVIKAALQDRKENGMTPLTPQQIESLEMISHKMGRILNGDPSHQDHWDDIAGYAYIAMNQSGIQK